MKVISIFLGSLMLVSCTSHLVLVRAPRHELVEVSMRKQTSKDEGKTETFVHFGPGPGETL